MNSQFDSVPPAIEFLFRGLSTKRYHTEVTLQVESVAAHVGGMAAVASYLYPDASADLFRAIALHDIAEFITGDIPAPVKVHSPEIKTLLDAFEDSLIQRGLGDRCAKYLSELSAEDLRRLKILDRISGLFFNVSELMLGNAGVLRVHNNFADYFFAASPTQEEVDFMRSFYWFAIERASSYDYHKRASSCSPLIASASSTFLALAEGWER